jgi:hypothetical protein
MYGGKIIQTLLLSEQKDRERETATHFSGTQPIKANITADTTSVKQLTSG